MQGTQRIRILLVEDEVTDARLACLGLPIEAGYDVHHVRTGRDALVAAKAARFDLVLLDHRLPDLSGLEVGRRLRGDGCTSPLVMISGVHQDALVDHAFRAGIEDFVVKDNTYQDRLADAVEAALDP